MRWASPISSVSDWDMPRAGSSTQSHHGGPSGGCVNRKAPHSPHWLGQCPGSPPCWWRRDRGRPSGCPSPERVPLTATEEEKLGPQRSGPTGAPWPDREQQAPRAQPGHLQTPTTVVTPLNTHLRGTCSAPGLLGGWGHRGEQTPVRSLPQRAQSPAGRTDVDRIMKSGLSGI